MSGCGPFLASDIAPFFELAQQEGWICGQWEFDFLLKSFPQGCFVWRDGGEALGYLTSVKYGRSGWIGNLLVRPEARRHGIGRGLMERAVSALIKNGVETVWLTASEDGAGIYQRIGFAPIDSVNRWVGWSSLKTTPQSGSLDLESVRAIDRVGWGAPREDLLQVTCNRGRLHSSSGGFICAQQWDGDTQIGPWGCLIRNQAGQLLEDLVGEGDQRTFLDVPAGNFHAAELLTNRGFTVKGSTILMYLGDRPLYQPANIFALASMGSMG